ncbi:MAG: hypothetical protein ACYDH5_19635 [Acidimicrobiales bacterium]
MPSKAPAALTVRPGKAAARLPKDLGTHELLDEVLLGSVWATQLEGSPCLTGAASAIAAASGLNMGPSAT